MRTQAEEDPQVRLAVSADQKIDVLAEQAPLDVLAGQPPLDVLAEQPQFDVLAEQPPLGYAAALRAVIGCAARTALLLSQHRIHLPRVHTGMRLRFADGTSAQVYRETVLGPTATSDPCVLAVEFTLRAVHGRGHAVFRWESLLNTPLFVGFRGFVSKLWLAHDERGRYRGVYEWDGARRAEAYARALWRVLALVSVPGSIHYVVLPGLRRDELLDRPEVLAGTAPDMPAWWRPVEVG